MGELGFKCLFFVLEHYGAFNGILYGWNDFIDLSLGTGIQLGTSRTCKMMLAHAGMQA